MIKYLRNLFRKEPPSLALKQVQKITKILILDDKRPDEIIDHLNKEGWSVRHLPDLDAISNKQLMKAHIVCLDIMDVGKQLGLNNGMDLAKEIKKSYPEKKIIMYSTMAQHNIFDESVDLVDKKLRKEGSLLPFSSAIKELAMKTLSWDDAVMYSYSKIASLVGQSVTFDSYRKAIVKSVKGRDIDREKLESMLKVGANVVDIAIPLMKLALHGGKE